MKKQFLLFCTSVFIVLSACSKAGERGETGPQGPQGLPGKDLVAKPLFSFDTSRMKVTSISSPSFKSSNKTVTNIISDLPKIVAATVTADNNLLGIKTLVEDNTLTANVNKEFKTAATAGTNAVGIMVPFLGEGIKAGSTITIKIAGTLSEGNERCTNCSS